MANPKAAEPVETTEPVEVVEPVEEVAAAEPVEANTRKAKYRFEKFEATRPDGIVVVVKRNIDTGEQTVTEK